MRDGKGTCEMATGSEDQTGTKKLQKKQRDEKELQMLFDKKLGVKDGPQSSESETQKAQ